jgi:D-threonate/D-erythronate kinase
MPAAIAVIADDMTGAAETAAQFTSLQSVVPVHWGEPRPAGRAAVSVFNTQSRDTSADDAYARALEAGRALASGPNLVFKRVDSLMRGPMALELRAIMESGDFDRLVLAPAAPSLGRVTYRGVQYLGQGSSWQPLAPSVTEVAQGLGQLWFDEVQDGVRHRRARPAQVEDAADDATLDRLVRRVRSAGGRVLWAGSTGLAAAIARASGVPAPRPRPLPASQWLAVIGSGHARTSAQIAAAERAGINVIHATPANIGAARAALERVRLPAIAYLEADADGTALALDALDRVCGRLLYDLARPAALIASGGRTFEAVVRALRTGMLHVTGAVTAGLTSSQIVGGAWDGLTVISKSGAFGADDLFVALAEGRLPAAPGVPRWSPPR